MDVSKINAYSETGSSLLKLARLVEFERQKNPDLSEPEAWDTAVRTEKGQIAYREHVTAVRKGEEGVFLPDDSEPVITEQEMDRQEIVAKIERRVGELRKDYTGLSVAEAERGAFRREPNLYAEYRKLSLVRV